MTEEKKEDLRAYKVWELEQEGLNKKQIAKEMGVSPKTISRIRRKDTYLDILVANRIAYMEGIQRMDESGQVTIQVEATKERGRMDRAGAKLMVKAAERLQPTSCGDTCPHYIGMREQQYTDFKWFGDMIDAVTDLAPWQTLRLRQFLLKQQYAQITGEHPEEPDEDDE